MDFMNRAFAVTAFLVLVLVSQPSNAIIIDNYTAFFDDGSKLVVDLKGYDYGKGSYWASPIAWDESGHPPVERFDTFFYPSLALQEASRGIARSGVVESAIISGLYFAVDDYYGVSMTEFGYTFSAPDWSISDGGVHISYFDHYVGFSGGFFETHISPYPVSGPGSLALLAAGLAGLVWARRFSVRKKSG
ncbi:hypothetical protein ACJO2E_14705 [Marinobacter sp. M1N3S26]|uniref:hypothetical protein n=1 Tax=unclassified Marinobacter TaxID=83889 RepID=UPI00387AA0E2